MVEISKHWDEVYEAMRRSEEYPLLVADRGAGRARHAASRSALARLGACESRASITSSAWSLIRSSPGEKTDAREHHSTPTRAEIGSAEWKSYSRSPASPTRSTSERRR